MTLAIIPARGGSKRIPKKNIREFHGKPLIAWSIREALKSLHCERVIVSTDDSEIAAIARDAGAEVPFLRPAEFAADASTDSQVFRHLIQWLDEHEGAVPEVAVWLRPTAPLRLAKDIDGAVETFLESGDEILRSVSPVAEHPFWMKRVEDGGRMTSFDPERDDRVFHQSQMLPPLYICNGAIDVIRVESALERDPLFHGASRGFVMPRERGVDIDHLLEFLSAEALMAARERGEIE